ncbi:MAG: amino acid adenylation domain-containing protein, partial [Acidobacteriota bacterium]
MAVKGVQDIYKLSPVQQGMLFHALMEPETAAYTNQIVRPFPVLDGEVLGRCWQLLVDRHTALRTGFLWRDLDEPVQVVRKQVNFAMTTIDRRDDDVATFASWLEGFTREDRQRGFDLEKPPLMRATRVIGPNDDHRLVWTYHHLVVDGWSVGLLSGEMMRLYAALAAGQTPNLPAATPFKAYVRWLTRQDLDRAERYWRDHLTGAELPTPLGIDRAPGRAASAEDGYRREDLVLDRTVSATIGTFCREQRVTQASLLQAAWAWVLGRLSDRDDVTYGVAVSGRPPEIPGVQAMVGNFINTLPARTRIDRDATVADFVAQVQREQVERQRYEYSPLIDVRRWSGITAGQPLFETLMIFLRFDNTSFRRPSPGTESAEAVDARNDSFQRTNFPLALMVEPRPSGMSLSLGYDTARFGAETIRAALRQLATTLEGMVTRPASRLRELAVLPDAERRRLLVEHNATASDYPRNATLLELIRARAAAHPNTVAVQYEDDVDGAMTYQALIDRVHRVAHALRDLGVGPETLTGIYLERSTDLVVATLAVHAAGGGYVPLDPAFPAARLAYVAEDAELVAVITEQALEDTVPATDDVPRLVLDTIELGRASNQAPEVEVDATSLAYVIYTSGSTGKPKGVAIEQRSLVNFLLTMAEAPGFTADDVLVALTTLSFDISGLELFLPLITGGRVVVASRETASDGARLGSLVTASEATVMQATPATWRLLLDSGWTPIAGLKVLCGGEALPRELADQLLAAEVALWNVYGPTETTIWSTRHRVVAGEGVPSIGRPIANTTIYTLDKHVEPTPTGVPGALMIGGDGLARGYYGRPALTAERFVPDPFAEQPGARLYHTGDLARWRVDGTLDFLGRSDFQVKVRGFRIELGEIETVLDRHPAVTQAVVTAVGSGTDTALAAYLIADGDLPTPVALRAYLTETLPDYMVPAHYVELDAFPLTPNGKVDRRALPEPSRQAVRAEYVAPRTPTEAAIATAIATVLDVERVGAHDDFFALGGHSLLATRLLARLRAELEVDLPLRQVFTTPDVAGLAAALDASERKALPPLEPVPRDRPLPATFAQERQWFLDRFQPGDTSYNLLNTVRLGQRLDADALRAALDAVVARHEVLRTSFRAAEKAPVQVIHDRLEVPLEVEDVSHLDVAGATAAIEAGATAEARRVFDLANGPLLALRLFHLPDDASALVLNMHHVISDAWSMNLLIRELRAHMAGESLPPLRVQVADVAVWQREHLAPVFAAEIDWWREQLDGLEPLDLPTDRPRPALFDSAGADLLFDIDNETVDGLRALAQGDGATFFMAMTGVVATLLGRWSGQDDLALGSPIAGRDQTDLEPLIGFFVNTLVLRIDLAGRPSFRKLLERVRNVALGVFDHQNLPFERLVDVLGVQRDASSTPLFQAAVVPQNLAERELALVALQGEQVEREGGTAKIDLTVYYQEHAGGLRVRIEYRASLFEAATIRRMGAQLVELMRAVTAHPDRPLAELAVLGADERHRLMAWSGSASRCLGSLPDSVAAHALADPGAVAVLDAEGGELSRGELVSRAHALAVRLGEHGVRSEEPVVLFCARSLDMVVATVGILGVGCVVVPLDPAYPDDRIAWILEDTGARVALVDAVGADRIPTSHAIERLELATLAAPAALPVAIDAAFAWPGVTGPDHIAHILYTSGSTGRPKGVMVTHANVQQRIVRDPEAADVIGEQTYLQISSPAFDGSTV